ncbi:hypothetical protein ABT160_09110, partial [Streptomyces sp. NPDC001941]
RLREGSPPMQYRTTARAVAAAALASALLLGGTAYAAGPAEPPPFPPPISIDDPDPAVPGGDNTPPTGVDPTWAITGPFKIAQGAVHGAFDIASSVWNSVFPFNRDRD